ncbi:MAG: hypothetical protein JRH06_04810 [Deltaproteobacteria bacterium]|nr:hypothetical protein [Deltaproteobacteria bacterium]MBW2136860.1 hypothetical protein [Deltaproteobacteria bacterium]
MKLLAALASADICIKFAAGKLNNSLGLLFYGACTFLTGLTWVLLDYLKGATFQVELRGLLAAIGVGVSFSLVTVGLYITFRAGAPISLVSPFVRLGGLLVASLVGLTLFQEAFSWRYAIGMVLSMTGVYLIVTR